MLKKLLSAILVSLVLLAFSWQSPVMADAAGSGLFQANCASCHMGGKNIINPAKTLNKGDLEKYGMNSFEAIVTQVTNGKAAMPSFKGRLNDKQIEDVAAYVLKQSEAGW